MYTRFLFLASLANLCRFALAAPVLAMVPAASAQGTRVNDPVVPGGFVYHWEVSADGKRVFYAAWQYTVPVLEVFDVALDGSQPTRALSAPFAPGRGCLLGGPSFQVASDGTRLVYLADQDTDEQFELYAVPTDGSRIATKLSGDMIAGGDVEFDFQLTPDGSHALYRADAEQDFLTYLHSVPTDASQPPALLHAAHVYPKFQITPDSSRVVFITPKLFSAPVDGSAPSVQLSDDAVTPVVRGWTLTPDGQRVVYAGGYFVTDPFFQEDTFWQGLYSASVDGSGDPLEIIAPISDPFLGSSTTPTFSVTPDSLRAVYQSASDHQLYVARIDGLEPAARLNELPFSNSVFDFRITPIGDRVVFTAGSSTSIGLYCVPVDRSASPMQIASFGSVAPRKLEVTPSGRAVFVLRTGGVDELYSVGIDGGGTPVKLSAPMVAGGGIWNATIANLPSYWLSPDGSAAIYIADQAVNDVVELYCVPVSGGRGAVKLSGTLVPGGDVSFVTFVPGTRHLVYSADQETDGLTELFQSAFSVDVPSRHSRSIGAASGPKPP